MMEPENEKKLSTFENGKKLSTMGGSALNLAVEDSEMGLVEEFTNRVIKVDDDQWTMLKKMQMEEHAGPDYAIRHSNQADAHPNTIQARGRSIVNLPILSAVHPLAIFWSTVTFLLDATYTSFLLPVFIAFLNYSDNAWSDVVDLIAGALFTIDLFMNFHIGYYAKNKGQVMDIRDGNLVAKFYTRKGPFLLDFIIVVTFFLQVFTYALAEGETAKVLTWIVLFFRLLRMFRVLKFVQLAFMSSMTASHNFMDPTLLHFLSLLFTTCVIVNFVGCTWYFVSTRAINMGYSSNEVPDTWITGYLNLDEAPLKEDLLDMLQHHIFHLWLGSVYFSLTTVTTVGYGDISGQNDAERVCSMFIFMVGVIFFSFLISSVTEMLANATKAQRRAQKMGEKLHSLKEWMQHRQLPKKLKYKLNRFYNEVYIQKQEDQEEEFLSEVPAMLRSEVAYFLTKKVMEKVVLFEYLDVEFLRQFASRFSSIFVAEGEMIFMEGDSADALYILDDGTVEITYKMSKYGKVRAPAVLGEQCLVAKEDTMLEQYLSTVHSTTQCRLWRLNLCDIEKLWQLTPDLERQFREGLDELVLQKMSTLAPEIRDKVKLKLVAMRKEDEDFHENLPIDGALLKMIGVLRLEQQIEHLSHPSTFPSVEFDEMPQSYVSVKLSESSESRELQPKNFSGKLTRQAKKISQTLSNENTPPKGL